MPRTSGNDHSIGLQSRMASDTPTVVPYLLRALHLIATRCCEVYCALRYDATEKRPKGVQIPTAAAAEAAVKAEFPSIVEIKRAIPAHCFQSDTKKSLKYALKDVILAVLLYALFVLIEYTGFVTLKCVYTPIYWFLQGTVFWAMFVVGHDCGHNSFSRHQWLNDTMGTVLHAVIMVPYYPWKLSHHHHHKNTGNIDRDEIFYPVRESDSEVDDIKPIAPGFGLGFAWFGYLIQGYAPRAVSHLKPWQPMFVRHWLGCMASLSAVALWATLVLMYWKCFGLMAMVNHYAIPCFVFGSWLVIVTFLHHNHPGVVWYGDQVWGNVKGQLATVDRHYGWAHELTHNIGTHQVHHLFTKVPHYHLEEATAHFRRAFPHLVRICNDPIIPTFFKVYNVFEAQRHIDDDTLVHIYY